MNCDSSIKTGPLISSRKHGVFDVSPTGISPLPTAHHSDLFTFTRDEYLAPIPEAERDDLMAAYHKRLNSDDEATRLTAAKAWSKWE